MIWLSNRWKILVMAGPALLIFTLFVAFPVIYSLWYSFTDFRGFGETEFVGFRNYEQLAGDQFFWISVVNTAIILVVAVFLLVPGAFFFALLLHKKFPGVQILRALAFAPAIIAPILVGLIWVFILDPQLGLVNRVLGAVGLPNDIQWIGGDVLSPISIALVFIWTSLGFAMTIFYAGRQMVSEDVMEASALDGATGWRQTRFVVIPMMRETIAIVTVLIITNVFKIFELVYMLTGGGPVHRSEVMVSYMYFVTFTNLQYGPGMAMAVIITVIGAIVAIVQLRVVRGKERN